MEDTRKIKEIYDCVAIISEKELYPLQKWYNQLIDKKPSEIIVADVLRMMRQKQFINLAMYVKSDKIFTRRCIYRRNI